MHAAAMPNLRARSRVASGSRLTAIEMNTRLSMPRTISIELRVTSRIQVCGSASMASVISGAFGPGASEVSRPQEHHPGEHHIRHQYEDRGRTHVLGPSRQLVVLVAVALDHRLVCRVEQLRGDHQQA